MQRRTTQTLDRARSNLDWGRLGDAELPEPDRFDGLMSWPGIVYASPFGYRPLELDILAAERAGTAVRPVVIWIHGGAFGMGSRSLLPQLLTEADFFERLARAGFVVVSVDYRLSGEAIWPAQILDVRAAIRWVVSRADQLGADPTRIAAWGDSAGGHLAAWAGLLAATGHPSEPAGSAPAPVAAVVDWYGPTDFTQMDAQAPANNLMVHGTADSPESLLIGATVDEDAAAAAAANPVLQVHPAAPPFLVRHGRLDRLVPAGQSVLLADALRAAGVEVDFQLVDGADHVFRGHADPARFVDEAIRFLQARFERPGPDSTS